MPFSWTPWTQNISKNQKLCPQQNQITLFTLPWDTLYSASCHFRFTKLRPLCSTKLHLWHPLMHLLLHTMHVDCRVSIWLQTWPCLISTLYLFLYSECAVKIIGLRYQYFTAWWNIFDFILVIANIFGIIMEDMIEGFSSVPHTAQGC